jgi:hypothetical protein
MKHILNNLSEEEKNSIREQHTGGMKVMTENFNKLLNPKLGDSKPLTEQTTSVKPPTRTSGSTGPVSFDNKTVNLYSDVYNKKFYNKVTIKNLNKLPGGAVRINLTIKQFLSFSCLRKGKLQYVDPSLSPATPEGATEYFLYNNSLTTQLEKTFCSVSSGGTTVPKADFAANLSNTGADFA